MRSTKKVLDERTRQLNILKSKLELKIKTESIEVSEQQHSFLTSVSSGSEIKEEIESRWGPDAPQRLFWEQ